MQNKLKENIINIYGENGRYWLGSLPNIVQEIAINWGLSDLYPFDNLSYNYLFLVCYLIHMYFLPETFYYT